MEKITNEQSIKLYQEFINSAREQNKKVELELIKFDADRSTNIRYTGIEEFKSVANVSVVVQVTNYYKDHPVNVSLFNPSFYAEQGMVKIQTIFKTISYEELMRLLLVTELDVNCIYLEVVKGGVDMNELLKQRIYIVRKDIDGSYMSVAIGFDKKEYKNQQIKSVMIHELDFTMKGLTYLEYLVPANTTLQFTLMKKSDQSATTGISPYAGMKGGM